MRLRVIWAAVVGTLCVGGGAIFAALANTPAPAAQPAPAGRFELVGSNSLMNRGMNSALAVHGRYAYVGSRTDGTHPNSGVLVVDVSDPASPKVVSQIGAPDAANAGESSRELRVWPDQDLLLVMSFACDEVGHLCAGGPAGGVEPVFRFFDIRGERAADPKLVATYRIGDNPHEFYLWDDPKRAGRALLYITTPFVSGAEIDTEQPHLIVTDISGARDGEFRELLRWSPERESKWDEAGLHSLGVSGDGRRAYLADLEGGFLVADTSELAAADPTPQIRQLTPASASVHHESPGAHSALQLPGRPFALITDEVYGQGFGLGPAIGFNVLRGCPWGWARLIDVRDPARPLEISEVKVSPWNQADRCGEVSLLQQHGASFSSHNPTLTPHLAVITWHSAGLRAVDLGDPARPRPAAEYVPEPPLAVATEDPALSSGSEKTVFWSYPIAKAGLVYVVDIRNGLYVLRYRGPYATELRCRSFLEGNSNVGQAVPRCGLRLRLAKRCGRRARIRGADRGQVRRIRLHRKRRRLTARVVLDDGTPIRLSRRVRRCGRKRR